MPPEHTVQGESLRAIKRMRAYQKHKGLSDERLGSLLGKTRSTIHRWRTEQATPPARMLWLSLESLESRDGLSGGRWNGEGRWEYDSDSMPPF